jgi:hypothetical protein
MRRYIDLITRLIESLGEDLFEAEIPQTEYGYWISPDGTMLAVPHERHEDVIRSVTKGEFDTYRAIKSGWVRVYCPKQILEVQLNPVLLSVKAFIALRQLVTTREFVRLGCELNGVSNDRFGSVYKQFDNPMPFIAFVRQSRATARMPTPGESPPGAGDL